MKNAINWFLLLTIFCLLPVTEVYADYHEKEIVVVIPSYNNRNWYKKNLRSILEQNYSKFKVIYIDDNSDDETGKLVERYLIKHDHDHRVMLIKNTERCGALANHYKAAQLIPDHKIIIHCDGDDWYAHNNVLKRVNDEYQNPDVWMTYGSYIWYPKGERGGARPVSEHIIAANKWRQVPYYHFCSQLRTFYAWLFKRINLEDLMINNQFFPVACDVALMYPMLEMAHTHVRFISDILYVYNYETPINDSKHSANLQIELTKYIMGKPPYKAIEKAPI
jgi:glycosyltransferase involved in cell wall biosynthesis